jgi:hypothetical protein
MGDAIYELLAHVHIQHTEHKQLYHILMKHKITGSFRYIDDILVICNRKKTNR